MKTKKSGKNLILISVDSSDLVKGVFENSEITEVADNCFYDMSDLVKVILPKCKKLGSYCVSYNDKLTSFSAPALTTMGSDCDSSNQH